MPVPSSKTTPTITRDIIFIDEARCNGCGACLPSCAEGALTIEHGKARIVQEKLCDGLGACLGACPRGALHIERRPVEPFVESSGKIPAKIADNQITSVVAHSPALSLGDRHWPIKLQLTPPDKPFLRDASLVLTADCAPASCPNFAARYLPGKVMLLVCPKLEDKQTIVDKLSALFRINPPHDITLMRMEVPCCCLPDLTRRAQEAAGTNIPVRTTILNRYGQENLPGFGKGSCHD